MGNCHPVKLMEFKACLVQGAVHDRDDSAHVLPGGDFGDDAAVLSVHVDLGRHNVGDYVSSVFNDSGGCLVARSFDAEYFQGLYPALSNTERHIGVCVGDVFIKRQTQSGSFGQFDVSILLPGQPVEHLKVVRLVELGVVFLNKEVRGRGVEVEAGGSADGCICVVRGHEHMAGLCDRGDFLELGYAAGIAHIRLENVDRVGLYKFVERELEVETFAGRDRDVDALSHLGHLADVSWETGSSNQNGLYCSSRLPR